MNRYLAILWFCMTLLTSCVHTEVEINGSIAGFVREKGTAKAIGGCSISIEPGNNQIYSSEDGSYSFTGLQMGDYTLTASKSGYEILTETITIGAGKTLNHDVMLTPARAPMVSTDSVTNLLANSATLYGTVVDNGGAAITKRGFYYGIDSTKMSIVYSTESSDSIPSFTYNIVDLEDGKIYYYQSFATNEIGEGKGKLKSFSTSELIAPSVKTSAATDIGTTSAILHGEITDIGNSPITQCGFYLGLEETPNQKYSYPTLEETLLDFSVSNLKSNTKYYYCIFAENVKGESKGEILSFTTLDTSKPIVYTNNATDVTANSAVLHATLSDNGGCEVTEYGFYIGTATSSLVKQKIENIQDNLYSYSYGNLTDGTTYYFQAYAVNEKGEGKGEIQSFNTTQLSLPEVQTQEVSDVSYTSAQTHGLIISNGSGVIKEYGFYYGIYSNPTTKIKVGSGNVQNYFYNLNTLDENTTYYVKAYARNDKGEGYGDVISFKTLPYTLPNVNTSVASNITCESADVGGSIISNGGAGIIECGICYSESPTPSVSDNKIVCQLQGTSFSCSLANLRYLTTYYVRAYAKNSKGVAYGQEVTFQTLDATYGLRLNGLFSISANKKVYFSGGNLQYQPSTRKWQFARHQYDIIGEDNKYISNSSYTGWLDLFAWGTGNNPTSTIADSYGDYHYTTFEDWGNNTIKGNTGSWRTLTLVEWNYLLSERTNAASKKGAATINGVYGWVLLPDNWTPPSGCTFTSSACGSSIWSTCPINNVLDVTEWQKMENNGAVFLPITGWRQGSTYTNQPNQYNQQNAYWISDQVDSDDAYYILLSAESIKSWGQNTHCSKSTGHAVRLVQVK